MKSILSRAGLSRAGRACLTGSAAISLTIAPAPVFAAGANSPATAASPREDGVQSLSVGQSKVVNLTSDMSDVIIADPAVVDVHVRSARQLYVIAKAPGQSNVTVTTKGGQIIYRAMVRVGNNLTSIDQMLRLAMPEADITVSTLNNTILLTGTVGAPEDSAEAERLVTAFVNDSKTQVISRLRTATPLQVNLQVRVVEVTRSISKSVGMNLMTYDPTSGFKFGIGQGRQTVSDKWVIGGTVMTGPGAQTVSNAAGTAIGSGVSSVSSGTTFAAQTKLFGMDILSALDLAEDQGLATTLANPNLTALSGETASFLAGGEVPIPMPSTLGATTIDYKQYGVSLAFTPTVLADGRISMRVRPEVSDLDYTKGVTIASTAVPGITTRRAETTVELGSGQSFMIGGLLSSKSSNSINKAPFLGDLPILGNFFKNSAHNREQRELVIVVTPYLVKPVNARDIKLPTDGYRNANDAQRYLGSIMHDSKQSEPRPVPSMAPPVTVPAAPSPVGPAAAADPADTPSRKAGKNAAPGFSF